MGRFSFCAGPAPRKFSNRKIFPGPIFVWVPGGVAGPPGGGGIPTSHSPMGVPGHHLTASTPPPCSQEPDFFSAARRGWGFSVCFLHIERCGSRPVSVERQSFPAFWMSSCTASVPHSLQLIVFGSLFSGRDHGPQLVVGQLAQIHAGHRSVGQADIDGLSGILSNGVTDRSEGLGITP